MPTFKRVEGEHNLFVDENGKQYNVTDGEMKEIEMTFEERLAIMDKKVKDGVIKCNLDNPEDCEACGS
jgi:secreted PhoX family phosphatase